MLIMFDALLLVFFPAIVTYAAVSDALTMTISNRVSLLLAGGFFVVALAGGLAWPAIGMHALAGMMVLVIAFGFFTAGWIGGGDAKLAAAIALWLGFGGLIEFSLVTAIVGGVLTLVLLKLRGYPLPAFALGWAWCQRLHDARSGVPYGIALAIGGLATYPHTALWTAALIK